jgi:HEPN domain-containing protein
MDDLMDTMEYACEWLEFAKRDVNSAEYLMNMWPRPDEIICYLSQQSAEKSLKGFLVINDITPPKIHNLLERGVRHTVPPQRFRVRYDERRLAGELRLRQVHARRSTSTHHGICARVILSGPLALLLASQ